MHRILTGLVVCLLVLPTAGVVSAQNRTLEDFRRAAQAGTRVIVVDREGQQTTGRLVLSDPPTHDIAELWTRVRCGDTVRVRDRQGHDVTGKFVRATARQD
jgi:hypothetical protein